MIGFAYLEEGWGEDERGLSSSHSWWVLFLPLSLQMQEVMAQQCVWARKTRKCPSKCMTDFSILQAVSVYECTCVCTYTCGAGGLSIWGLSICKASSRGVCFFLNLPSGLLNKIPTVSTPDVTVLQDFPMANAVFCIMCYIVCKYSNFTVSICCWFCVGMGLEGSQCCVCACESSPLARWQHLWWWRWGVVPFDDDFENNTNQENYADYTVWNILLCFKYKY